MALAMGKTGCGSIRRGAFWPATARRLPKPLPESKLDALGLCGGQAVTTRLASVMVVCVLRMIRQSLRALTPSEIER